MERADRFDHMGDSRREEWDPSSSDLAEPESKRSKANTPNFPGSSLGYHPGMMNSMAMRPPHAAAPLYFDPPKPSFAQWSAERPPDSLGGAPALESSAVPYAPAATVAAVAMALAPPARAKGPEAFDRAEAAALLLGIRETPSGDSPSSPHRPAGAGTAPPPTGAHQGARPLAAAPAAAPTHLGPMVDTRATTVEGFFWSWLLSGPGLGAPPLSRELDAPPAPLPAPLPNHANRPSVLPWPEFVLGEIPTVATWKFV